VTTAAQSQQNNAAHVLQLVMLLLHELHHVHD
jgi:hypothetical protein